MPGITDLDITYGSSLAPPGFHKIALPDGGQAELNRGSGKSPSFLWYHDGAGRGDPIVEIRVVHGDGDVDIEEFEKLPKNMLKGLSKGAYIYFRRGKDIDPIGHIQLVYDSKQPDEGFELLEPAIIDNGSESGSVYISVQRVSRDGPVKWSGFSLCEGDWCDALDSINNWCVAQIVEADATHVKVHFKGWASKWDEVMSRGSTKLAELGTQTSGKDTGWSKREQGVECALSLQEMKRTRNELRAFADSDCKSMTEFESFWRTEACRVIDTLLTSSFADCSVLPTVNGLLRDALDVLIASMMQGDFNMGKQQMLGRLFMLDDNLTWYYDHYGIGIAADDVYLSSTDLMLDGPVSKVAKSTRSVLMGSSSGLQETSKLLITNLNHFGSKGGFAAICRLIDPPTTTSSMLSLAEVHSLVALVRGVSYLFTKKFCASFLPDLQLAVVRRLHQVGCDTDLRELMEVSTTGDCIGPVDAIWKDLELILRSLWKDFPFHETHEKYKLFLCKVFMTSPYLNLRIRGLSFLNDILDLLNKKELAKKTYGSAAMSYYSYGSRQHVGDSAVLRDHGLSDNHDEILKRSQTLLLFVASKGALTESHLQLLWRAGQTSASSGTTRTAYTLLASLSGKLSPDYLAVLLGLIRTLPRPIDEAKLGLVKGVLENAVSVSGSSSSITADDPGLSLLWESLMTRTSLSSDFSLSSTQRVAADALASILSAVQMRKLLPVYMERCIDIIRGKPMPIAQAPDGQATFPLDALAAMHLLRRIVEQQPEASRGLHAKVALSRDQIIKHCEDNYDLIDALMVFIGKGLGGDSDTAMLDDMTVESVVTAPTANLLPSPVATECVDGSHVKICMSFLEFILVNSSLDIDFRKIHTLWHQFSSSGRPEVMEQFFGWIQSALMDDSTTAPTTNTTYYNYYGSSSKLTTTASRKCLTDDAVDGLFTRLIGASDPPEGYDMAHLDVQGFAAIEKLFRSVNGRQKKLLYAHNKLHFIVNVVSTDLAGFDILMRAYLYTDSMTVAKTAADFLISLQIKYASAIDRKKAWIQFTKYCMNRIHSMATMNDHTSTTNTKISRILKILSRFFDDICSTSANLQHYTSSTTSYGTSSLTGTGVFRLTVFWKREGASAPANQSVVYLFKKGTVTIGALRARIARDFKVSPRLLRLVNSSRTILTFEQDDQMAEATGVNSFIDVVILRSPTDDTLQCKPTCPAMTLAEDPDSDQMYPRKVLSDSKTHLLLMFEILSDESVEVSQSAWDLLDLLPINSDLLAEMKSLGGAVDGSTAVSWESLLSEGGILRQQYKLKIISTLLDPLSNEFSSAKEKAEAIKWGESFVRLGGPHYLLELALAVDVEEEARDISTSEVSTSLLQKELCLALQLQLLAQLVNSDKCGSDESLSCRLSGLINTNELFGSRSAADVVTKLMRTVQVVTSVSARGGWFGSDGAELMLDPVVMRRRSSSSFDGEVPNHSAVAKRRRKLSRVARFEQYFSSAAKNTSAAVAAPDRRKESLDDEEDNDGDSVGRINHAALIVQYGLSLVASLAERLPNALDGLKADGSLSDMLHVSLIECADGTVRDMMSKGLIQLCNAAVAVGDSGLYAGILRALHEFLPEVASAVTLPSDEPDGIVEPTEYFFLFSELIRISSMRESIDLFDNLDLKSFAFELCDMVTMHPSRELSEEEDDEDKLLQGIMLLFKSFLEALLLTGSAEEIKRIIGVDKGLVLQIFRDCLFLTGQRDDLSVVMRSSQAPLPKCKTLRSRDMAFSLLNELCRGCVDNMQQVLRLVLPHHSMAHWDETRSSHTRKVGANKSLKRHGKDVLIPKSKTGYCGLYNPSCICYMNSTLQQLFMVPEFRNGILGADTDVDIASMDSSEAAENMLFQLQLLFAYLQESDKAFVDPTGFSASFKDYEGQPTDVNVQQDASEFLSNFFQQVEGCLMSSRGEALLKDTFGGMFCNELLAEGGKRSERAEPFFMLSVSVGQGRNTLEDGLASFIEGETVDYTWETSHENDGGKKVTKESLPTVKRVSIRSLPRHLIIHLKRFEFDFETMQQIKINERFTFPLELDMFPYTVEGRDEGDEVSARGEDEGCGGDRDSVDRSDYIYELAGVVVHVGTAHSGHYYSYIKERSSIHGKSNRNTRSEPSWFEFNDSFVSEFDIDDLEDECFGGEEVWRGSGNTSAGSRGGTTVNNAKLQEKARNAFMLVYDKKIRPSKHVSSESESADSTAESTSAAVVDLIRKDNESFWRTKSIFNARYYKFTGELIQRSGYVGHSREIDCSLLECAVSFTFGTLAQAREREYVAQWCAWIMDKLLRRNPACAFHLLGMLCRRQTKLVTPTHSVSSAESVTSSSSDESEPIHSRARVTNLLKGLLLDIDDGDVRSSIMKVILVAMEVVLHSDATDYSGVVSSDDDGVEDGSTLSLELASQLIQLLRDAQLQWRNISVFFSPISVLAKHSERCRSIMQSRNYIACLVSLFLAHDTPYPTLVGGVEAGNHKSRTMTDGYTFPDWRSLLKAVAALLPNVPSSDSISCDNQTPESSDKLHIPSASDGEASVPVDGSQAVLSPEAQSMIESAVFIYRLLRTVKGPDRKKFVFPIVKYTVYNSKTNTNTYIDTIVNYMKKEDGTAMKIPMRGAMLLCEVDDGIREWRVGEVMRAVTDEMKASYQYVLATETCATMLIRICKHCMLARQWVTQNSDRLRWLDSWLNSRRTGGYPHGSFLSKMRRTANSGSHAQGGYSGAGAATTGPSAAATATANLSALRALFSGNSPSVKSAGHWQGSGYDSDDDPVELIGKKLGFDGLIESSLGLSRNIVLTAACTPSRMTMVT